MRSSTNLSRTELPRRCPSVQVLEFFALAKPVAKERRDPNFGSFWLNVSYTDSLFCSPRSFLAESLEGLVADQALKGL